MKHQKSNWMIKISHKARCVWQSIVPGPGAWRGAAWGALTALLALLLVTAFGLFRQTAPGWFLIGLPLFLAAFLLAGGLLTLVWSLLKRLPAFYTWVLASALPVFALLALIAMNVALGIVAVGGATLVVTSLMGAGIAALREDGGARLSRARRGIAVTGMALGMAGAIGGGAWLLDAGSPLEPPPNAAALSGTQVVPLDLPDPSQPGLYPVRTLIYGSGDDRRRAEYGAGVNLVTQSVDGTALIDGWSGLRTAYWGFGPESLPLNGRVWYPEGAGRFPLVVFVHGQHPVGKDSDPGYAYLGELLASRGFIAVSVDENFLNLSPLLDLIIVNGLEEENDLRGWLLLEHLQLWRDWGADPSNPFYQKVDLDDIALIGHSRGGEAVAIAAAFNKLPCYPDNAALRFDYGFSIRSVVGIAPVDGAYVPADQAVPLENINYLVLHGTHDMDVFTFQGTNPYARVRFDADAEMFKAVVYIYGANHGQFNTIWGRKDLFEPVMRVFNLEQLLPGEAQRQIAKVTIGAFLEATLHGEREYRALFQDLRHGKAWLPDTIYLTQYQDSATQMLSTYEEDIDLTSTTLPGGRVSGENLTLWHEQAAQAKWERFGNQTVYLGWDASVITGPPSYALHIPDRTLVLSEGSVLVFAMADANEDPTPDSENRRTRPPRDRDPVDLTVEVIDGAGTVARLPLSHFAMLQPQLEAQLGKARLMSMFPQSEAVLQSFAFPLADFVAVNPALDPTTLTQVRFRFDRTEAGVIVLDDLGFRE